MTTGRNKLKFSAVSVLILLFHQVLGQANYTYQQPKALNDGWQTNHLLQINIDTARFSDLFQQFNQADPEKSLMHSVLVVKDNHLVVEEYFGGYAADQQHDVRSVTKSITALLMGIAIDQKFIHSVNDPIINYLGDLRPKKRLDERKKEITIAHLLTMSSGLDCDDWNKKSKGREDKVFKKKNWLQYFLDLPMVNDPGTVANYCTMGQVLAVKIIENATGLSIQQFAEERLFAPMQIKNVAWGHTEEDKEIISAAKRLYMLPRDMAKIGQLILNQGKWRGEQLVSKEWIEMTTTPKTTITNIDYGYFWWNYPFQIKEEKIMTKLATGNGGQYIFSIPSLNLVAVFTGGFYNSERDKLAFKLMYDIVLPSFL